MLDFEDDDDDEEVDNIDNKGAVPLLRRRRRRCWKYCFHEKLLEMQLMQGMDVRSIRNSWFDEDAAHVRSLSLPSLSRVLPSVLQHLDRFHHLQTLTMEPSDNFAAPGWLYLPVLTRFLGGPTLLQLRSLSVRSLLFRSLSYEQKPLFVDFCNALEYNDSLRTLELSNCGLADNQTAMLFRALGRRQMCGGVPIRSLSLQGSCIRDAAIAELLQWPLFSDETEKRPRPHASLGLRFVNFRQCDFFQMKVIRLLQHLATIANDQCTLEHLLIDADDHVLRSLVELFRADKLKVSTPFQLVSSFTDEMIC
jgi:hypothetical protein